MVPRQKLFSVLKRSSCSTVMLAIFVSMYRVTKSIVASAAITATLGVRQGFPSSCISFILFMTDLIKVMKEKDFSKECLHILVLMNNTVILSTVRHTMIKKAEILVHFYQKYGMIVDNSNTFFFNKH